MAKRSLELEEGEYLIFLEECDDLDEGYYVGHIGINQPIYGRGDRVDALVYTANDAIRQIRDWRDYGYPCHAEPPIQVTY